MKNIISYLKKKYDGGAVNAVVVILYLLVSGAILYFSFLNFKFEYIAPAALGAFFTWFTLGIIDGVK